MDSPAAGSASSHNPALALTAGANLDQPSALYGLVFGRTGVTPFDDSSLATRAARAPAAATLHPITLHEARHTFASLMIAAGVNAKALSTYMGHASVTVTYDRYSHLMPGNEEEAASLLDAFLLTKTSGEAHNVIS